MKESQSRNSFLSNSFRYQETKRENKTVKVLNPKWRGVHTIASQTPQWLLIWKSRVGKIVGLACCWGLWISGFPHLVCLIVQVMVWLNFYCQFAEFQDSNFSPRMWAYNIATHPITVHIYSTGPFISTWHTLYPLWARHPSKTSLLSNQQEQNRNVFSHGNLTYIKVVLCLSVWWIKGKFWCRWVA